MNVMNILCIITSLHHRYGYTSTTLDTSEPLVMIIFLGIFHGMCLDGNVPVDIEC